MVRCLSRRFITPFLVYNTQYNIRILFTYTRKNQRHTMISNIRNIFSLPNYDTVLQKRYYSTIEIENEFVFFLLCVFVVILIKSYNIHLNQKKKIFK